MSNMPISILMSKMIKCQRIFSNTKIGRWKTWNIEHECLSTLNVGVISAWQLVNLVNISKKLFLRGFILKPMKRVQVLLKNGKSVLPFNSLKPASLLKKRLWHRCFPVSFVIFLRTPFYRTPLVTVSVYVTIISCFERFQYFNFEISFWKTKTFFKKQEYHFLVGTAKIENELFP